VSICGDLGQDEGRFGSDLGELLKISRDLKVGKGSGTLSRNGVSGDLSVGTAFAILYKQ
jgi:hypothetical protein